MLKMHKNARPVREHFFPSHHPTGVSVNLGDLSCCELDANSSKLKSLELLSAREKTVDRLETGTVLPDVKRKSPLLKAFSSS